MIPLCLVDLFQTAIYHTLTGLILLTPPMTSLWSQEALWVQNFIKYWILLFNQNVSQSTWVACYLLVCSQMLKQIQQDLWQVLGIYHPAIESVSRVSQMTKFLSRVLTITTGSCWIRISIPITLKLLLFKSNHPRVMLISTALL